MRIALQYRFEALTTVAVQFIVLLVNSFFWRALYAGKETVAGTSLGQMLVYSVISVLLGCFFSTSVEGKLRSRVRQGNIAVDFIKPVNIFGMYFAEEIGEIVVSLTQKGIPLLIFACFFVAAPVPASFLGAALFLASAVLSFLILWLIAAVFGMLNFWLIDIGPLGGIKDQIIIFLSGGMIPIWFFPEPLQKIMAYTPFIYIYQTPISIYIGKLPPRDAAAAILIQASWCAGFYFLYRLAENKTTRNIIVQGG